MVEETVEIGGTEVEITETDDGFEVTEVEQEPESGVYLRAESAAGGYGFELPLGGDYVVERTDEYGGNNYAVVWDTTSDVSDLDPHGSSRAHRICGVDDTDRFDGYAAVNSLEIVERE